MCTPVHDVHQAPVLGPPRIRHARKDRQRHPLLIAALRLQERYTNFSKERRRSRFSSLQERAGEYIDRYFRIERQLHRANRCGFHNASEALVQRCSRSLRELEYFIRSHHDQLVRPLPAPPSLRDIHLELLAAEDEFGAVDFAARENVLSVTTQPITLEGLELGRFRIELNIADMTDEATDSWYCIEALDPNPPSSDEDVTHPHVQSGKLCAGDAIESIHHTLRSGRISEFFIIVRSVLETYNDQSPYVTIEDWHGRRCYDCDNVVGADDCRYCEGCSRDFCDNCASYCYGCDQSFCLNCMRDSELSPHMYCNDCYGICSRCERVGGREELTDSLCPACQALAEDEESEQPDDPPTTTSHQEPLTHDHEPGNNTERPQADDAGRSVPASGLTATDTQRRERHHAVQSPPAAEQARSAETQQTL